MADHGEMRASDADRAEIAQRLRAAADEGRLRTDEFDSRLGQALDARTYGELDRLVHDLPRERAVSPQRGSVALALRRRRTAVVAAATGVTAAVVLGAGSLIGVTHTSHAFGYSPALVHAYRMKLRAEHARTAVRPITVHTLRREQPLSSTTTSAPSR